MNLREPFTLNIHTSFSKLMGTSVEDRVAAYRDPVWRAAALADLESGLQLNSRSLSVAESDSFPELIGRSVVEIAEERDCTWLDALLDISLAEALETRFSTVLANNDPDAIAWLLRQEGTLIGLADSGAHLSQLCDACFATDLLGNWVREREVLSLEGAVHKLTGEPAAVFGLTGRGTVEVGQAADLCVFDPATIDPGPIRRLRDFPADGERLTADAPVGVTHVLVNGVPIRLDGSPTDTAGARPGVVLRR
jgi:N-acyl-D-aspartate/D-glutamate deacylase